MDKAEIEKIFGFDPEEIGRRPRGYWVVEYLDDEEVIGGARVGDLCVRARDGGGNPPDLTAGAKGNFVGTSCDTFDETYRNYYYRALD